MLRAFIFVLASVLPAMAMPAALPAAADTHSFKAEVLFRIANPCPATGQTQGPCKGYVIDRIVPAICGGAEEPGNMQWQTVAEAKEKDKWERIGCRPGRKQVMPTNETFTEAYPLREPSTAEDVPAPPLERAPLE